MEEFVDCNSCGHLTVAHIGEGTAHPDCDCCSWRKHERPAPVRSAPPAGFSTEKWSAMNRAERRSIQRASRRAQRKGR